MDYRIHQTRAGLDSTGFMEIGPGRYSGKHWKEGFLFVLEDAFTMAEGILAKHLPSYDHLSMNDLPRDAGRLATAEWREAAARLDEMSMEEAWEALQLSEAWHLYLKDELHHHRTDIAKMLGQLADACDRYFEKEEWVCILGI